MLYTVCSIHQPLWMASRSSILHHYSLHSRFSHAMNFVDNDGNMITFLSVDLPSAPNTAVIECESFDGLEIEKNETLVLTQSGFCLGDYAFQISPQTGVWRSEYPVLSASNIAQTIEKIECFLVENCEGLSAIEKVIYEKLDELYQKAIEAYHHQDFSLLTATIKETIGLGLGLTPSGDDRLVGFLLGCYALDFDKATLLESLQNAINSVEDRTNDISYAMLKEARAGHFNEWLIDLVHASNNGDPIELAIAMEKVFSIGSRSGGDMLKGLALFLPLGIKSS